MTTPPVATTLAATTALEQTAVAGTSVPDAPAIRVSDQGGKPMQGVSVLFAASGGGSLGTASALTNAAGVASAESWMLGPGAGLQSVTASVGSLAPVRFSATAQARAATTIAAVSAADQAALAGTAVAQPPAVRVNDQTGQPLAGVSVTFAVTAGGGTLTIQTALTDAGGVASSGAWTLGAAGANRATATVQGLAPVAFTATAAAPVPSGIAAASWVHQGNVTSYPVGTPPAVLVTDQAGRPLEGITVAFAVTEGGGVLAGAHPATDAEGVARVQSWTLGPRPGMNAITATVAGLPPVRFTAEALQAAPARMEAVSPISQSAPSGMPVPHPPTVRVVDHAGYPVPGVEVAFRITGGFGSLARRDVMTDADGLASAGDWTLGGQGGHTVSASVLLGGTLEFTAQGTDPCAASVEYALFTQVAGVLNFAGCQHRNGELVDFYSTSLATAQAVVFQLSSSQFQPWLGLYDGSSRLVAYNFYDGRTENHSAVRVFAPAGRYVLGAGSWFVNATGWYELSSVALAGGTGCEERWIVPGVVFDGQVQSFDCASEGFYSDQYSIMLRGGETLEVRMQSTAIDPHLRLQDGNHTVLAEDGGTAGGPGAAISHVAQQDQQVYLHVTSASAGQTGSYTLTVTRPGSSQQRLRMGAARAPTRAAGPVRLRPLPARILAQPRPASPRTSPRGTRRPASTGRRPAG